MRLEMCVWVGIPLASLPPRENLEGVLQLTRSQYARGAGDVFSLALSSQGCSCSKQMGTACFLCYTLRVHGTGGCKGCYGVLLV